MDRATGDAPQEAARRIAERTARPPGPGTTQDAAARNLERARRDPEPSVTGTARRDSGEQIPIGDAATRLGATPRMLRYRESLGLLPRTKELPSGRGHHHRRFSEGDLSTIEEGLRMEHDYDITPTALDFALQILADPGAMARVRAYGERVGRLRPPPTRALDFEKQKALRLLSERSQPR